MALIRALSQGGSIDTAFTHWEKVVGEIEDEGTYRSLIEALAWGILSKHANQLNVHMTSIVGASITQDARALPILLSGLSSPNAIIRSVSAKFSNQYRDSKVVNALLSQVQSEKVWYVRLELIRALGQLRVTDALPLLEKIISDQRTTLDERGSAMTALCMIREDISEKDVQRLVESNRVGERHLAANIVLAFSKTEYLKKIAPLLSDSSPEVRVAAINAFALLENKSSEYLSTVRTLIDDSHGEVAITAAWALAVAGDRIGYDKLKMWLFSPYPHLRQTASSAISFFAYEHEQELLDLMKEQTDPYVRLNIARGIISSGSRSKRALNEIAFLVQRLRQKIMVISGLNPLFHVVTASNVRHTLVMQQYPLYIDSVTRLELINILAVRRHPEAELMLKTFLSNTQLGVTFNAAVILVQEGVEESIDLVRGLLEDKSEVVRLQAALILAFMGEHEQAYPILEATYQTASRETKINILQAMGHIRSQKSIDFLLKVMKDPFLVLRVVSASSLIQSVYN